MTKVVPTVLADNAEEFRSLSAKLETFTDYLHYDVGDGEFSTYKSPMLIMMAWQPKLKVALHMMVKDIRHYVYDILALQPHLVILHLESDGVDATLIDELKIAKIQVGLAILQETSLSRLDDFDLTKVDEVLVFGGTLGENHGKLDEAAVDRVEPLRNILKHSNPKARISWDGGVKLDNVADLASAGIDVLYSGSAVSGGSDEAGMEKKWLDLNQKASDRN